MCSRLARGIGCAPLVALARPPHVTVVEAHMRVLRVVSLRWLGYIQYEYPICYGADKLTS